MNLDIEKAAREYCDKLWKGANDDDLGARETVRDFKLAATKHFTAGANYALEQSNAKNAALEQSLKLEKMRGDHSSFCPNHQETKGLIVTEEFKANGVVVDCQYYKCPECDMTWLSGRQEHDVDAKIKEALEQKVKELEKYGKLHMENAEKWFNKNAVLEAKLKKCIEQRNDHVGTGILKFRGEIIADLDKELASITAESLESK